ncbi:TIGR03086 family metal-binding protein [Amycolatopsis suaedae]|uniref:TIGR03086 family protein n=1 Tax=Amycolatopsis suaedae TaxID=2510978 RepID=A0A4Q7J8Q3_9PSEU|nr:TIGR03086 family metal-binding protein [Amycolatopsis suaedae]RZQ62494.1 TIGR03086 family protein [Amycolatopsis suaedae]
MRDTDYVASAARTLTAVVRGIDPGVLDAATPCSDYDVRGLLNHLLFWGPSLEGAGRKETVPPPAGSDTELDLTGGDWAADLAAQLSRTAKVWSEPAAWQGMTHMGGPTEMPAPLVGGMVAGELVVHGWDLAAATGQQPEWDAELIDYVYAEAAGSAELGRQMGVYGPEVAVAEGAPALHRLLGVTGRDPAWTP